MSTITLEELNQEEIRTYLKKVLKCKEISAFTMLPSAVNTTFMFSAEDKKYVMKLMTTPTTAEWEKYRFDKVGKLFEKLANNPNIPAPQVIYTENSEKILGYRFIIISYVEGENLWNIWRNLSQEEIIPIARELGKIVKEIHSIKYDFFGEIEDIESAERYYDYKDKILKQLEEYVKIILERKVLPEELVVKVQKYILANIDEMYVPAKACLLHNDIHQGNLIVKKDAQGIYKIQALLDWEWACADNPIEDIIYIEENVLQDPEVKQAFYSEYYQGEHKNLDAFAVDIKLFNILWKLDDIVCGWTFHNPTSENLTNAKIDLENLLGEN